MSSGTIVEPYAAKHVSGSAGELVMERIEKLGLSPRQQALNSLWAWYRCQHYDARKVDWDGKERVVGIDFEAIATAGSIPPGFYDAGQMFPLKFRRPSAPYALVKVVVDRFTGLLFSERRHPQLRSDGDPDSEDYVTALIEAARLWPAMIQARAYGGAMGTVAFGFQFVQGKPQIEIHDPRWLTPEWKDRSRLILSKIEKRYQYPVERRNDMTGKWEEVPCWYRRVIDEQNDVLFKPVEVRDDGLEPNWQVDQAVHHGLGFCPIVWVQNLPVNEDVDGDPDCHGIYDVVEQIDSLIAQGNRGTVANCDPTLVVASDAKLGEVRKGSDNAIKLPSGSTANYLEVTGSGPKTAFEAADKLRSYALEVAQCVLEHPDISNRTATEIERTYASMTAKADILREQYGQKGVLPLVVMMLAAVKHLSKPRTVSMAQEGGGEVRSIERRQVVLPPRVIPSKDGESPPTRQPRALKDDFDPNSLTIQWGPYFDASPTDIVAASNAASGAKEAGLVDAEHASKFVAPYFHVEDVHEMLAKVKKEQEEEQARVEQEMMSRLGGAGAGGGGF